MTRILVVEDDPGIAFGLELDLRAEGYEVEVVGDGASALERARHQDLDLMLLDIMLPLKDGFEVCRELRRSGVSLPIILLTAKTQESDKVLGLESGADDFITKPFSPRELRARVKAVLRRTAQGTGNVYRFGDVEVDFARGELRRAGVTLEITPLEFKLLSVFISHRGRLLTRQQILDAAWGRGIHVTDRVVDNHIVNLRKKIEPRAGEPRYLVSVRGLGYRFDG